MSKARKRTPHIRTKCTLLITAVLAGSFLSIAEQADAGDRDVFDQFEKPAPFQFNFASNREDAKDDRFDFDFGNTDKNSYESTKGRFQRERKFLPLRFLGRGDESR